MSGTYSVKSIYVKLPNYKVMLARFDDAGLENGNEFKKQY
jgi:hypothetical protein